jgi:hypothetical protein
MVQRSDDNGDKRSHSKSSDSGASPEADAGAVKALRDRIRQAGAGVGAAMTAPRNSDHAPVPEELLAANSSKPPSPDSTVRRSRAGDNREPRAISLTPPLFGAPVLKSNPISVPWPAPPAVRNRSLSKTRVGLGVPPKPVDPEPFVAAPAPAPEPDDDDPIIELEAEPDTLEVPMPPVGARPGSARANSSTGLPTAVQRELAGDPADEAALAEDSISEDELDSLALSTARTQPMPRVRNAAALRAKLAAESGEDPEELERRRLELATTRKTQGLLRAPDAAGSHVGRYSVHDVSAEYVDTGVPEPTSDESTSDEGSSEGDSDEDGTGGSELGAGPELEGDSTRPRRSTPKQRVGHRRSSRPELGHGRVERGNKRTDPGIRARTLRGGGSGASPASMPSPLPASSNPPALETSTVVVDPSLSWPPRPAAPKPVQRSSSYVPLPRDREAYEAFLRSAAGGEGPPARARPIWAQQETALIPRESLEQFAEADHNVSRRKWLRGAIGIGFIALSAPVIFWLFSMPDRQLLAVPVTTHNAATSPQPPAAPAPQSEAAIKSVELARPMTLVSTEPSGAEMLMGGAVIGNTPLEVTRPAQGEELYLLRLRGFESQMVKLTAQSRDTMHITLLPGPQPPRAATR